MRKRYILYSTDDPFPGYIAAFGIVDVNEPPDGSTVMEWIDRMKAKHGWEVFTYPLSGPECTEAIRETKKWDWDAKRLIDQEPGDITPKRRQEMVKQQKAQQIASALPDWQHVETALNNMNSMQDVRAFLTKLARVVYWMARNSAT